MASWAGPRDYNTWRGMSKEESTDDLFLSVSSGIYCLMTLFAHHPLESTHWIIVWNAYIEMIVCLEELGDRGYHGYTSKLAAEAIVTRLENALDAKRAKGRESRIARKLAAKKLAAKK